MNDSQQHCVVIGAGIIGASCAWYLQRKGLKVTLIDAVEPGQSCTFGNAACISRSSVIPFSYPGMIRKVPGWILDPLGPMRIRPLALPELLPWFWRFWRVSSMQNVEAIATAQSRLMDTVFDDFQEILSATDSLHLLRTSGAIHVYDTEKEYRDDLWQQEMRSRLGYESQLLSKAELKALVPGLKLDHGVALMMPDWHQLLDPAKVTQNIADHCISNGAHWIQDRVSQVDANPQGVSLRTESGVKIEADNLVVAAGAWSNILAEQLDYKVPMIAKRGYHSQIAQPGIQLDYPVMSLSRVFVMTPMSDGLRIAGTAEFAALDAEPDYRRARVLLKHAADYLEGLQTEGVTEWMGQRPMMADSMPVISTSPQHRNVFYAFGHGHYGLTQGPTTGRHIADMVSGGEITTDLAPFRFDRFRKS
jgi:D-amino-acid dehydrogenase